MARIEPLVAAARAAADADEPGEAFVDFVRNLSDEFANFKALADAMVDVRRRPRCCEESDLRRADRSAVSRLLERAQECGRIRPDVTIGDVSAMMAGISHTDPDPHGSIAAEALRGAGL